MVEGFTDAFAREAVEGPNDNYVESAPECVRHHCTEPAAVGFSARFMILILSDNGPALRYAALAKLR